MAETRVVITAEANQAIQEFERLRAQATGSLQALGGASNQLNRTTVSAAQTAAALRQVPAQFTDIVVSLQAGQAPITVLLQQGGQLRDMFGSASGAARALGGYVLGLINPVTIAAASVGVLAYAYHQGSKETEAYNKALVMSGNVAGTTAGQLSDMARNISKTVGTQGQAAEVLAEMADTGKIASSNMEEFTKSALQMEKAVGRSAAETVKDLSEIGKAPVEASLKLNEQYHYLTAATYAQIKALEDQGRTDDAAAVAQKAYSDAFAKRAAEVQSNLGILKKGWNEVAEAAKKGWDRFWDIGRTETKTEELGRIANVISLKQASLTRLQGEGNGDSRAAKQIKEELEQLRQLQEVRQADLRLEVRGNEAKANGVALDEAKIKWAREGEKYLTRKQQMERDIVRVKEEGKAANIPEDGKPGEDTIAARIKRVMQGYADLNNASMAGMEAQRALEREVLAGRMSDLESAHRQGIVSDEVYVNQKREIQLKDLDGEKAILKKQADLAGGKADLSEQTKYLGAIAVIEQRRRNIIKDSQDAIAEYSQAGSKAVKDQAATWGTATAAQMQSLQDEISLYGKSAEARAIATAQMKIDGDMRALIADKIKQKHPLNEQELADLKAEAEQYKTNIAAILGQRQALAGAEQLRKENQKYAVESIADEQQRAAGLLEIDADVWRERIGLAVAGSEAQKKLQGEFDVWYANRQMAPVLDRWKGIIGNLDNNFQQGFRDMLTTGHGAWKSFSTSIANTLKTSLADALYQTFIKKYVVQIVANMAGAISGPAIAAALSGQSGGTVGGEGAFGMFSSASNLYSAGKTIYSGFNTGLAGSIGGLATTFGNSIGSAAISAYGTGMSLTSAQAAAAAAQYSAAATVATAAGNTAAAGTYTATASGLTGGAGAASAIPIVGWIMAGMAAANGFRQQGFDPNNGTTSLTGKVVGAVPLALNNLLQKFGMGSALANILTGASINTKLFGRASPRIESQGLEGTINSSGVEATSYANILEKGGWFRSDKRYTKKAGLDASTDSSFDATIQAMIAAVKGFGSAMHIEATQIDSYSKAFNLSLTGDATKDQATINSLFADVGNELSARLIPAINTFSASGEAASATLQRLATDYVSVDNIIATLGRTSQDAFGGVGAATIAMREKLIAAVGGIDALASQTGAFVQNYFTDAERNATLAKQVTAQMTALGYAGVTTKDQFKELVLGLNLSTESGQKAYAALMSVQGAFSQVQETLQAAARSAADIANERAGLQDQLDQLTMTSAQLLEKQRRALDGSNQALFDQVQAAKKSADAQTAMTAQYSASAQVAADAIAKAQATAAAATASLGNSLVASMNAAKDAAAAFRSLNDALLVGAQSTLSPEAKYAAAKQQYLSASGPGLQAAEQALLTASKEVNGSSVKYARDFAEVYSRNSREAAKNEAIPAAIISFWRGMSTSGGIGAHANGGIATGWSVVGEQGPELAHFAQPARIYTASQTRAMMGGSNDTTTKENTAVLRQVLAAIVENTKHTRKTADIWQRVTKDGNSLQTTVA